MDLVFIETPEFVRKFDKIATQTEMILLQNELIAEPCRGKVIRGTGGARKIRIGIEGSGKSGGARVIYYYVDLRGEIWLLDIYRRNDKSNLDESDKKRICRFIKETIG